MVDTLETPQPLGQEAETRRGCTYCLAADVWGDSREEVIRFSPRGASIHANTRPLALPTLYNETLYPGI